MLPEKMNKYLVDLYRAWDAIERAKYKNPIIDFDLAPPRGFPSIGDRHKVLERLENAAADLEGETDTTAELARARLKASVAYLRALSGESIAFRSYIRQTLGVEPRKFSDERIRKQRALVNDQLRAHRGMPFSMDQIARFRAHFTEYNKNKNELLKTFKDFQSKWVPKLLKRIPVPMDEYKVNVTFANEDAYWKNWISGKLSEHEILLRINIHPRQVWYQGFPETLVIHEYCGHAVQMINWHRRIEQGELPEFLGILTVHFPDQFLLEGLAESLVFVLPRRGELTKESYVARQMHRYYLLIMNNTHIIANEQNTQTAFDYAVRNLPFTSTDVIQKEIRDRTQNPLFRCYQYVYGVAKESFLTALSRLEPKQGWKLLRMAYDWPMTATQFEEAVIRLATKAPERVQPLSMA